MLNRKSVGQRAGGSTRRSVSGAGFLACCLTLLPAGFLLGFVSFDGLAHVVADRRVPVLRSGRAAGAGFAGFRRAGQAGQCLADVPEPAADPGGGQPAGRAGPLPGQPEVGSEAAGEVQLGVAGQDEPGPPVGGGRVAQLRAGPAEDLLEEPERVLLMQISSLGAQCGRAGNAAWRVNAVAAMVAGPGLSA